MRRQQIVGRVFADGDIKVVALKGRDNGKHQLVEFECRRRSQETGTVCGRFHICRFSSLKSGAQTSCGCGKRERIMNILAKLAESLHDQLGIDYHRAIAKSSHQLGYRGAARKHDLGKLGAYLAASITASIRQHDEAIVREFLERYRDLPSELEWVIKQTESRSAFGERPYRETGTFTSDEIRIKRDGSIDGRLSGLMRKSIRANEELLELPKTSEAIRRISELLKQFDSIFMATVKHRADLRKYHAKTRRLKGPVAVGLT